MKTQHSKGTLGYYHLTKYKENSGCLRTWESFLGWWVSWTLHHVNSQPEIEDVLLLLKNLFICVYIFMNYVQQEHDNLTVLNLWVNLWHLNINMGSLHLSTIFISRTCFCKQFSCFRLCVCECVSSECHFRYCTSSVHNGAIEFVQLTSHFPSDTCITPQIGRQV